jgi:hypothetical protein
MKGKQIKMRLLSGLQPSQLYISRQKLAALQARVDFSKTQDITPVPVKYLDRRWVMTDGHTRAFAAHSAGLREIPTLLEEDDLDWEAYRICVDWCQEVGITEIADLEGRILEAGDYDEKWLTRCEIMQQGLAEGRKAASG